MKIKKSSRIFIFLLAAIFMAQLIPSVSAHSSSQEGILAKTHEVDGKYYIGGDEVGWSINEDYHTNGTVLTYSFSDTDPELDAGYKALVINGAALWSGTVKISRKADGTGTGLIETCYLPGSGFVARTGFGGHDANGHLTVWMIQMNRAYTVTALTLAHEFGHAIGLVDLYGSNSKNKLMYGYSNGTATGPTDADKWGAKVITGVHSSHTWGYTFYGTNSSGGNMHVKYCTDCNGRSTVIANCVYNTNNICKFCGIPKGVQPWSLGHELN